MSRKRPRRITRTAADIEEGIERAACGLVMGEDEGLEGGGVGWAVCGVGGGLGGGVVPESCVFGYGLVLRCHIV